LPQFPGAPRAPTAHAQNSRSHSRFLPCHAAGSENQPSFLLQSNRKAKTPPLPARRKQRDRCRRGFFQSAKSSRPPPHAACVVISTSHSRYSIGEISDGLISLRPPQKTLL